MNSRLPMIDKIFVWSSIVIASNFFGLYQKIAPLTQIYFTDMISFCLCAICGIYLLLNYQKKLVIYKRLRTESLAQTLLVITFIEVLLTTVYYSDNQSFVATVKEALMPLGVALLFFSWRKIADHGGLNYLIKTILKVSIVCSCFAIIAYLLLEKAGNNFFNLDVSNYSFYRYNKPHFMIGSMIVVPATIFAWMNLINRNRNRLNVATVALGMIHIVIIGKTRTLIAFTLMTMVVTYIYLTKKSKNLKLMVAICCGIGFVGIEASTIVKTIGELFLDNSVTFRLRAIEFYLDQVWKRPLFGMGFIGSGNEALKYTLYGPQMQFYRTDVGFIGFLNEFGIIGALWFFILMAYAIKLVTRSLKRNDAYEEKLYAWGMVFFVGVSAVNLFFVDVFRIVYAPLLLVLIYSLEKRERGEIL